MKQKLELNFVEVALLEKLAKRSKMDNWFAIDENNNIYDRENGNRRISTRNACKTLIEGLTTYDIETLSESETLSLINLALKV